MIYTSDELLKLVHDTGALSIWDRKKGPVYWYAAGVPGPFYINTELVIGPGVAADLLDRINAILASTPDAAARAAQLGQAIMAAYDANPAYKKLVATMAARALDEFPAGSFAFVSGGERRDWLFSIPFARETGMPHVYLFKNMSCFCDRPPAPGASGLHVSDLINNAASYLDLWLPALEKAGLACNGTVSVINRGMPGVEKLAARGIKTVTLNNIDLAFFARSQAQGLISRETLDEVATHDSSAAAWGREYLTENADLYDVEHLDKKSFERLQSFFANDPWGLKPGHEEFFAEMQARIAERLENQAA